MINSHLTSIARPYARAAFEYALEKNALPAWETMLSAASVMANDEQVKQLMSTPAIDNAQLADLFCQVLGTLLSKEMENFIRLLASYKRLAVLPAIAEEFKRQYAAHTNTITGEVISAVALSAEQLQKISKALTQRLKLNVTLDNKIDTRLLGGAVIRVGAMVIDGSVTGKLRRMVNFI